MPDGYDVFDARSSCCRLRTKTVMNIPAREVLRLQAATRIKYEYLLRM